MLDLRRVLASKPKPPQDVELTELWTPWGEEIVSGEKDLTSAFASHPNPQMERAAWTSLDGTWECAFVSAPDAARAWRTATPPERDWQPIRVPFSPEAPLSGVGRQLRPDELLWYRRAFEPPALGAGERLLVHFEAVDWACSVYVNGVPVCDHTGGYLPFFADVTDALRPGPGANHLALCVFDPSDAGTQLRGKQRLARGGIWYTAQSGIWQEVWCEVVPATHVSALSVDARLCEDGSGALVLLARVVGEGTLIARLSDGGREVARASVRSQGAREVRLGLALPDARPWKPSDPHLYDIELTFGSDRLRSYCGFRRVELRTGEDGAARVSLNRRPIFLRGVLDQGYWPDGLMTAPAEAALAHDILAARGMGFNLLRMHLKVESRRFYALCDRLGILVWQDMVSGGGAYGAWHTSYKPTLFRASWSLTSDRGPGAARRLAADDPAYRREWRESCAETVRLLRGHPSVVGWTLFNEGWGQFDARAACDDVRALDPTRLVSAASGWYDQLCGDVFSVHNYFRPLEVWRDPARERRAFVISEFGGVSWSVPDHVSLATSYGYDAAESGEQFACEARALLDQALSLRESGLAGFVYTQLSDVEEETNGLLTYDRRVNKLAAGE
ncbi:glycoside hydrolase family 2 protein [Olsenella profusa]|uniref:Glycoside hydrolase family 2 n=1 Tax=Olsenella profusa TaxID=138595 RepID=A0ABS2F430_9ACTN|nr:sugar-binding domain-containing protein [Olsenella profusa]MBM6775532.1 glycoside hydrolase family 2 [Olsenella profusa]